MPAEAESSWRLPIGGARGRGRAAGLLRTAAGRGVLSHRAGRAGPDRAGRGADGRGGARCLRSELRRHSHERLPRLHREAEPGRQGEGCGEVLQGIRPHPGHRSEEGLWVRGECGLPQAVLFGVNGAACEDNAVNGLTTHVIPQISVLPFLKGAGFLLVFLLWWFCRSSRIRGTQMMRSMNWMEKSFVVRGTLSYEYIRLNMSSDKRMNCRCTV